MKILQKTSTTQTTGRRDDAGRHTAVSYIQNSSPGFTGECFNYYIYY